MVRRQEENPCKEHRVLSLRKAGGKGSVHSEEREPLSPRKPLVSRGPGHSLPLGKESTALRPFSRNRMFVFSLRLGGLSLLQHHNLLAFLFHKVKFLLRFFLTRAKLLKRFPELEVEELVSGAILLILGSCQGHCITSAPH